MSNKPFDLHRHGVDLEHEAFTTAFEALVPEDRDARAATKLYQEKMYKLMDITADTVKDHAVCTPNTALTFPDAGPGFPFQRVVAAALALDETYAYLARLDGRHDYRDEVHKLGQDALGAISLCEQDCVDAFVIAVEKLDDMRRMALLWKAELNETRNAVNKE